MAPRERFGRGRSGSFDLYISKDREGFVLGALEGAADAAAGTPVGCVEVTSDGEQLQLSLRGPKVGSDDQFEVLKTRVSVFLAALPAGHPGATTNFVKQEVNGNRDQIKRALDWLVSCGYVDREPHGKQSVLA